MRERSLSIFLVGALVASDAWAHAGHFAVATFGHGFEHPWIGLDHALAALAVGAWASAQQPGGRWRAPTVFVVSMVVGALTGHAIGAPVSVDAGIAGSLVLLGAMLLGVRRWALAPSLAAIAVFAALHGLAHGVEAPAVGSWPAYLAGLATGTTVLHGAGLAGGRLVRRHALRLWPAPAIACSLAGAWLLMTN